MLDVVQNVNQALAQGRELVLCEVVETKGTTPQKAAVLMLVHPDGGQSGTLGGGCVENEVRQTAIRSRALGEFLCGIPSVSRRGVDVGASS
jgi:xanthine dehydrogenase accessory factor